MNEVDSSKVITASTCQNKLASSLESIWIIYVQGRSSVLTDGEVRHVTCTSHALACSIRELTEAAPRISYGSAAKAIKFCHQGEWILYHQENDLRRVGWMKGKTASIRPWMM